jgi:[protein-PII] uridylyltransferase
MSDLPLTIPQQAAKRFAAVKHGQLSPAECTAAFQGFLRAGEETIRQRHRDGGGGLDIAQARAEMFDLLLQHIYEWAQSLQDHKTPGFSLIATGGYGRGILNPCSDIDLLFLISCDSKKIPPAVKQTIETILYQLWDMGLKVGHSVRSVKECIAEAFADQQNKTAMLDTRLIAGESRLYQIYRTRYEKACVQ